MLQGYREKFESKQQKVSTFGGHAYDALFMTLEAVDRVNSTDRSKLRDEIEKTTGFLGTGDVFSMGPDDHLGLGVTAFHMVKIRKGE